MERTLPVSRSEGGKTGPGSRRALATITAAALMALATARPMANDGEAPGILPRETILRYTPSTGRTASIAPRKSSLTSLPGRPPAGQVETSVEDGQYLLCCGSDDRIPIGNTTVFPYSTVCKVEMQFPFGGSYVGSAVMVGPRHALTAGHVIYDGALGGWATSVRVTPAYDFGYAPWGSHYATNLYSQTGWTNFEDSDYDFGIIEFGSDVGDSTGWMGYAVRTDGQLLGSTLNTAGYPGDLYGGEGMYFASGPCTAANARTLHYNGTMDTAGGQSGSGVWTFDGTNRYVVAVHTFGTSLHNGGTRITSSQFDLIQEVKGEEEPPPPPPPAGGDTLTLYPGPCKLKDAIGTGKDMSKGRFWFTYNDTAPDEVMNPYQSGMKLTVKADDDVLTTFTVPANSSTWKVKGGYKYTWSGWTGSGKAKVVVDTWKDTVSWSLTRLTFTPSLANPISVTFETGNDKATMSRTWFEKSPWMFSY